VQRATDRARGDAVEAVVSGWLGGLLKVENFDSTDRLDIWLPGVVLEIKGKYQPYGARFSSLRPETPEFDLFMLDELGFRKAMTSPLTAGYPLAYFVLFDKPQDRWFLARVDEIAVASKVRVNRAGNAGHLKGKLLLDLLDFRQLANPETDLMALIADDLKRQPWKDSGCLTNNVEVGIV
jgi:hypothetical protein